MFFGGDHCSSPPLARPFESFFALIVMSFSASLRAFSLNAGARKRRRSACCCLSISICTEGAPALISSVLYQDPFLTLALGPWIAGREFGEAMEIEFAP